MLVSDEKKGFGGLGDMVSDISDELDQLNIKSGRQITSIADNSGPKSPNSSSFRPEEPKEVTYQAPAQPSDNSGWKWILGISAVIVVIWMAAGSGNKNQTSPSYSSSPSAPSYSPPAETPAVPSRLSEELPPVGTNNVLSSAQLRYCLAEDIRLESAKAAVNNFIDSHVDRFNGMVSNYNSRCGQFRYRKGALESARSEVERYRADLQAEGRGRFSTGTSAAPKSPPQVVKPTPSAVSPPAQAARPEPDSTVFAIQQRLNQLGYNAGVADGFAGGGTRASIIAFQRDRGLSQDGVASVELLNELGKSANRSNKPVPSSVASPPEPTSQRPGVP